MSPIVTGGQNAAAFEGMVGEFMRSAIYYPETVIGNGATLRAALLMWDEIKVIVPWEGFQPDYRQRAVAEAWELIGSTMCPDRVQRRRAHQEIEKLLESQPPLDVFHRDGAPAPGRYEIWPQKLLPETWDLLRQRGMTMGPQVDGAYPFEERGGLAVMSKLADACAGTTFARWTDRFLAYGLVADRDAEVAAQTAVVPMTLSLLDASSIPIERLIEFRRREQTERRGSDYRAMRHRYADALVRHVEATKAVESPNELKELRRWFEDDMRRDLRDLRDALGVNATEALTSPVVVTTVVAAGSWLATKDPLATATATAAGGASAAIAKVAELFRVRAAFSSKQRKIMAEHPMAYLYQLSRG